ncbi:MAG: MoaD/ThiS family protein [Betaproteobacteria bacterium]|nr:MAG: MoaD/ThiS family protein [Betaproteobacteria bacterium]TMH46017.1 MAG: MoaD/ThiS family protein [Betaproteobacteria bacterium]
MPRVVFTSHLQRHVRCAESEVSGATVGAALQAVFRAQPQVRDYVLDEQGELRRHVFVFVDGRRARLDDAVGAGAAIHVLQALTGG